MEVHPPPPAQANGTMMNNYPLPDLHLISSGERRYDSSRFGGERDLDLERECFLVEIVCDLGRLPSNLSGE